MRMVVRSNSMMRKMMQFMMLSDWTKALAVWLVAPWFVLVLLLSALNQGIRVRTRTRILTRTLPLTLTLTLPPAPEPGPEPEPGPAPEP